MDTNTLLTIFASILAPIGAGFVFMWRSILNSAKAADASIEERRLNLEQKHEHLRGNVIQGMDYCKNKVVEHDLAITQLRFESVNNKTAIESLRTELKEGLTALRQDLHVEIADLKNVKREETHSILVAIADIAAKLRDLDRK
jgi:hypothetical protein